MPNVRMLEIRGDEGRFKCSREKLMLQALPLDGIVVVLECAAKPAFPHLLVPSLPPHPLQRRHARGRRPQRARGLVRRSCEVSGLGGAGARV